MAPTTRGLGAQEANSEFSLEGGKGNIFLSVILSIGTVPDLDVIFSSEWSLSIYCVWTGVKG